MQKQSELVGKPVPPNLLTYTKEKMTAINQYDLRIQHKTREEKEKYNKKLKKRKIITTYSTNEEREVEAETKIEANQVVLGGPKSKHIG